jgi:hypothetical protein
MIRVRYVDRVATFRVAERAVGAVFRVAVTDPDAAAEAAARTDAEKSSGDDRPRARVPRRG